ncbi:MAG: thiamine pyrophosphate-dependent dehydrogenase E1 component subunit alpha [Myxococcales bacterium]|nr:thiamine pyrophosphate-dependent dehydrogenase E1 component subunit alpha [Myxococcales bacterium]
MQPRKEEHDDPALGLYRVLDDAGKLVSPAGAASPDALPPLPAPPERLAMYRAMRLLRRLDERMLAKQRQGLVGFYGSVTGQEAVPIACGFATRPTDWVFPALRESSILLTRGFPLATYLAQVYGNAHDVAKGRQMPSHMAGRSANVVSWSSVIGPQLPQAVGAAMAAVHRGDDMVALAFSGDGATSQGDFHAALNFAGVFRAPVVFVVQNNQWAISVPVARQTASATFAQKASAYGLPGVRVDGNDALAVHHVVRTAVERARRGEGPTLVECLTYRIGAHSSSDDPSRYRDEAEVERWRARDPLARLRAHLRDSGLLTEPAEQALEAELEAEIADALRDAEAAPAVATDTLLDDVYATRPAHLETQRGELLRYPRPHTTPTEPHGSK